MGESEQERHMVACGGTSYAVQVDAGAENIARQCSYLAGKFRSQVDREKCNEHNDMVATGLEKYLMSVVNIHSEIRAVIHQKKLSMLEVNSVDSRAILMMKQLIQSQIPQPGERRERRR